MPPRPSLRRRRTGVKHNAASRLVKGSQTLNLPTRKSCFPKLNYHVMTISGDGRQWEHVGEDAEGVADGPEWHVTDSIVNQHSCLGLLSRKQMPGRAQAQPEE